MHHRKRQRLGHPVSRGLRLWGDRPDALPFLYRLACLSGELSINADGPGLDPLLQSGARLLRKPLGKQSVEPLPVGLGVHEKAKPIAIIRRVWRIVRWQVDGADA
jgi:hypothetical protein